jgi:ComF family protein
MDATESRSGRLLGALLDFAFPPLCPGCDQYLDSEAPVCAVCRGKFDLYDFAFCVNCRLQVGIWPECPSCGNDLLPLFALGNYVDPLKQVVIEIKFRGILRPLDLLANSLVETFGDRIASRQADCLTPIPLHPTREYERGYNQASELAHVLSHRLDLPVADDLLVRTGKRRPQQILPAARRAKNIRGVFEALDYDGSGRRILLVDDVVTSGETVREAARVLAQQGHCVVGVLAIAHGV